MNELQAGRELDAFIAEAWMDFKFLPLPETNQYGLCDWCGRAFETDPLGRGGERGYCHDDCNFSDEMNAAWKVVERLRRDEYSFFVNDYNSVKNKRASGDLQVIFQRGRSDQHNAAASADTLCLAICRAAYKLKTQQTEAIRVS